MFEQEVELEKRQSAAVPLLLIAMLIIVIVGFAGYYVIESRKVLTTPDAANLVIDVLKTQGPTTVSFHTGMIKERADENPRDPRYRLLQKVGVLEVGKAKGATTPVVLSPRGSELLKQIAGVKQSTEANGNEAYVVPLAFRKLVDVSNVTMTGMGRATVQFTWQWEPNALGDSFDTAGPNLKSFSTWDRQTLIENHGARFYHETPTKVVIAVKKTPQGWRVATE